MREIYFIITLDIKNFPTKGKFSYFNLTYFVRSLITNYRNLQNFINPTMSSESFYLRERDITRHQLNKIINIRDFSFKHKKIWKKLKIIV